VPLATVDAVARGAFIKAVIHDGTKVDTIVHYGRHALPAVVRTAIELGEPPAFDGITCTDCDRRHGLQWDHVDPVANGGPTSSNNIRPRCYHCHQAKTERDRRAGLLDGRPP
jgi:5-methylcytosine-specific restriction endonuclease McrA